MKQYRYHPEIEGLKINEDGSEILMNESLVTLRTKNDRTHSLRYINYKNKRIGIARLILESWTGLAPRLNMIPKHRDGDYTNYHYSNLQWGNVGGNSKYPPKLLNDVEKEVLKAIEANVPVPDISNRYNISERSIYKLIKKQKEK